MKLRIAEARTAEEVARCFPVMRQLRTRFTEEKVFVDQVERQRADGFRIACLEDNSGSVRAVAATGWRSRFLPAATVTWTTLVTDESVRSLGFGGALFDWLVAEARSAGCVDFQLDSGVQRFAAHRFYLAKRMIIASHHFTMEL